MKTPLTIKEIQLKLQETLDEKRYEHTLGVAKTAQMLAWIYGLSPDDAYIAGLLHDCAKNLSTKEKFKICQKYSLDISDTEEANPSLLHAKCGAILASKDYGISNTDILNAISSHTTGRPQMSLLEKIVFVADYIEPGREDRKGMLALRKLAFIDINKCVLQILHDTLEYLSTSAKSIDPMTANTYNYYLQEINNNE